MKVTGVTFATIALLAVPGCLELSSDDGRVFRCNLDGKCPDGSRCIFGTCVLNERQPLYIEAQRERLVHFPLPVWLDRASSRGNQAAASSLRFLDADGTELAHEIELVDDKQIVAWVIVPQIEDMETVKKTGKKTFIQVDFRRPPSSSALWDGERYASVYHFGEDGAPTVPFLLPLGVLDSTENGRDGTITGSSRPLRGEGPIGSARGFDGDGAIEILAPPLGEFTISGWFKQSSPKPDIHHPMAGWLQPPSAGPSVHHTMASRHDAFWLGSSGGYYTVRVGGVPVVTNSKALPLDSWVHLAMTVSGSSVSLYVDGDLAGCDHNVAVPQNVYPIYLGASRGADPQDPMSDYLDGALDEVRIETVARPATWIKAEVRSQTKQMIDYGFTIPVL